MRLCVDRLSERLQECRRKRCDEIGDGGRRRLNWKGRCESVFRERIRRRSRLECIRSNENAAAFGVRALVAVLNVLGFTLRAGGSTKIARHHVRMAARTTVRGSGKPYLSLGAQRGLNADYAIHTGLGWVSLPNAQVHLQSGAAGAWLPRGTLRRFVRCNTSLGLRRSNPTALVPACSW